jgi:hypothetical protein
MIAPTTSPDLSIDLRSALEREYIKEYLQSRGYQQMDFGSLPAEVSKKLMAEACTYASLKLEQIASRAKFLEKIQYV